MPPSACISRRTSAQSPTISGRRRTTTGRLHCLVLPRWWPSRRNEAISGDAAERTPFERSGWAARWHDWLFTGLRQRHRIHPVGPRQELPLQNVSPLRLSLIPRPGAFAWSGDCGRHHRTRLPVACLGIPAQWVMAARRSAPRGKADAVCSPSCASLIRMVSSRRPERVRARDEFAGQKGRRSALARRTFGAVASSTRMQALQGSGLSRGPAPPVALGPFRWP